MQGCGHAPMKDNAKRSAVKDVVAPDPIRDDATKIADLEGQINALEEQETKLEQEIVQLSYASLHNTDSIMRLSDKVDKNSRSSKNSKHSP